VIEDLVGAAAATLGGLTGGTLGADDAIVAACDTDGIVVGYTTAYSAAAQTYQVSAVNLTTVNAACNAKAASVTLRNGATALGTNRRGEHHRGDERVLDPPHRAGQRRPGDRHLARHLGMTWPGPGDARPRSA